MLMQWHFFSEPKYGAMLLAFPLALLFVAECATASPIPNTATVRTDLTLERAARVSTHVFVGKVQRVLNVDNGPLQAGVLVVSKVTKSILSETPKKEEILVWIPAKEKKRTGVSSLKQGDETLLFLKKDYTGRYTWFLKGEVFYPAVANHFHLKPKGGNVANARSARIGYANVSKDLIRGRTPAVSQSGPWDCWAAAAAILYSWRDDRLWSISEIKALVPLGDKGLDATKKEGVFRLLGLKSEPSASHSWEYYTALLRESGPLWVTVNRGDSTFPLMHSVVVVGARVAANGSQWIGLIDPATGSFEEARFGDFFSKFDEVGKYEIKTKGGKKQPFRAQIGHF